MTQDDLLIRLLQRLNEPAGRYADLDRYYQGKQPLAFLSPEAKTALGNRFGVMASNVPRLAVTALAERLRITGFSGDGRLWSDWIRNDLDQTSGVAHREALLLGDSFVIVWADRSGRPLVSVESARQVSVLTDPGTREIIAGIKRWEDQAANQTHAILYLPDRLVRLRAEQTGAVATGFKIVDEIPNPIGSVPLVNLRNSDRILADWGTSEIDDLKPLVDGANKILVDMLTTSEYVGRPRRWATGIELTEEPVLDEDGDPVLDDGEPVMRETNPIPEGNRAMISEQADAKFGQLAAADLGGYEAAMRVLTSQIMAVSTLPAHYLGTLTDTPPSADALRAAEASLTARAEARQHMFGRSWEQVAKLMIAVRDGRDPGGINDIRVQWADAATRSVAQEADAVVKLFQAGLLTREYALAKLGYAEDEIRKVVGDPLQEVY
ncbi:phage portal protein [Mycolicibacterium brumae]|uniref:phage portal protein n=1 Tax=Mycolicibacterium brumae TaxID=85968 RepID=UPI001F31560F|nr:phage portal protein [Mycolicibacterium brumae]UWW07181.1 phage portal protein [Mycolicibacterium brumae]